MHQDKQHRYGTVRSLRLRRERAFASLGLLALACSGVGRIADEEPGERGLALQASGLAPSGKVAPIKDLPLVEPVAVAETFVQRLPQETAQGENVALHVRLPPPSHDKLKGTLVRVLGDAKSPLLVFSSDALAQAGKLKESPGPDFFTTFLRLDEREIELRLEAEKELSDVPEPSQTTLVFEGRTPIAVTTGLPFGLEDFQAGRFVPLGICPIRPASTPERWAESLMIVDPEVVQDPTRTNDACTGGGAPNGVWTFKHLMRQMALGSGSSTHEFVVSWLSNWLRPYTVNGDVVPARRKMFDLVILPWAKLSGVNAELSKRGVLTLSGRLNLNIAPFRLSAIVNRIDLGATVDGPAGYGGGVTSQPLDAGELRFVFGVQNLSECSVLPFSVIFEYGVPITGCSNVRTWARQWTRLNSPGFAARFSPAWRAHLESLTESVVLSGAAPAKGNQSALNQLRTNEIALAAPGEPWELREFTLSIEDPVADTNTPANGPLRTHTVAMTPDDAVFSPTPHPTIDAFVLGNVACGESFSVPGQFSGAPFRGGNSLTPPPFWLANVDGGNPDEVCSRHEFSLNTCNGCHSGETDTRFLHVDPTSMPAGLSNFLTGGGAGSVWQVDDVQFGSPTWQFADLDRRFEKLYSLRCTACGGRLGGLPSLLDFILELNHGVPIDPIGPVSFPFDIAPVVDIDVMLRLLEVRGEFLSPDEVSDVGLQGAFRAAETFVH